MEEGMEKEQGMGHSLLSSHWLDWFASSAFPRSSPGIPRAAGAACEMGTGTQSQGGAREGSGQLQQPPASTGTTPLLP